MDSRDSAYVFGVVVYIRINGDMCFIRGTEHRNDGKIIHNNVP